MKQVQMEEAFVRLVDRETADRSLPANHPYRLGMVPNMVRLIMSSGKLGETFGPHFASVMFNPGFLSRQEREMVASVAAAAQDCHY